MKPSSLLAATLAVLGMGSSLNAPNLPERRRSRRPNRTWSRRKISLTNGEYHLSPSTGNVGTQPGQRYHRRRAVREEGWKAVKNAAKAIREAA